MKIEHKIRTFTWWWYLLIGITGLVVFGMIAYSHHKAVRMNTVYAPLIDAALNIKLEATTAHLWFEEILSGDRHEDLEAVWKHLDQADWYARAMLEGGTNYEGTFIPLDDEEMRQNIVGVQNKLSEFRNITEKRLAARETSGAGTDIDQHYDAVFNSFISVADEIEHRLQEIMTQDLHSYRLIQTSLIVVSSFLLFVVGIIFYRFEHRRIKDVIKIRHSNEELKQEIAEHKHTEDDLKRKSKLIRLQQEITLTANDAENVEDALKLCMNKICSFTGWPIGHIYMPDSTGKLIPANIWYISDPEKYKDFQEITRETFFRPGEGLPGRTFSSGKPHWIVDVAKDPDFHRAQHAMDVGIKSGFAFPVLERKNVVAILEFFSNEIVEPDKLILKSLRFLAIQLGRIIERKRAEDEFIKTQKLESIGVLAGGIAHGFNNYLQGVLSNIGIAKDDTDPNDKIYKNLTEAEEAVRQAKNLTKQLLTFSKGGDPVRKTFLLPELLRASAKLVLRGSYVRCEFGIPDDLWSVEADKGQIYQVISNLFINADHAMPEGGNIRVWAENINVVEKDSLPLNEGRYVKITVKDHGTGISHEDMQKIFDPYFTTRQEGSGLGLSISYSIIKKHDGYISVESEIGDGTSFHIYLPASDEKIREKPAQERVEKVCPESVKGKVEDAESTTIKGRVLLMDDEALIRLAVAQHMKNIKYEVETAKDGTEAIKLYKEAMESGIPFGAVILDLTIPGGMGGAETIKKLLEIDPDVKAIVSSGYSDDPIMADFSKYGFSGVLAKPYEMYELDDALREVIGEK